MRKTRMIAAITAAAMLMTGCSCVDTLNAAKDGVNSAISGVIGGIQSGGRDTTGTYKKWQDDNKDVIEDIDRKTSADYEKKVDQVEREQEAFFEENGKNWYGRTSEEDWYGKPEGQ